MPSGRLIATLLLPRLSTSPTFRAFSSTARPLASEAEIKNARQWLKTFDKSVIPQTVGDVSYSRSSGPGGQNVNKVNSKAQLRVHLDRLLPVIPLALHNALRLSRYYAKDNTLLIQSDDSRKQATNRDTCWSKLCMEISRVGKDVIPGETSEEQKERVKELQKWENEARIQSKKQHAGKKAARTKGRLDF